MDISSSDTKSPITFVVWPPIAYQGNEARGVLVRSSIVKTLESGVGEGHTEINMCVEKTRELSMKLPNQELDPCEEL